MQLRAALGVGWDMSCFIAFYLRAAGRQAGRDTAAAVQ